MTEHRPRRRPLGRKETGKLAELQKKWFGETYDDLPNVPITSPEQFHKLAGL